MDLFTLTQFGHLRGEPRSQVQVCVHCGAYPVRHSLNCAPISLNALHVCGTCRWVKEVNSISRPRLYPQIADRAKSELHCKQEPYQCSILPKWPLPSHLCVRFISLATLLDMFTAATRLGSVIPINPFLFTENKIHTHIKYTSRFLWATT